MASTFTSLNDAGTVPPIRVPTAASERPKPEEIESMAVAKMVTPVVGLVNSQHDPHSGEPQLWMVKPLPMLGNVGSLLKVGNLVTSPLGPLEHATLFNDSLPLSKKLLGRTGSTVEDEVGGIAMAAEKRAARVMMVDANFMVRMRK